MSKTDFNESFKSPQVAPAFGHDGAVDFDEESLLEALGESSELNIDPKSRADLARALHEILKWLIPNPDRLNNPDNLKAIGIKVIAMAWTLDPSRFGNDSLAKISKHMGFTAANISPLTADFSRRFGVTNEFQKHNWRKEEKPAL